MGLDHDLEWTSRAGVIRKIGSTGSKGEYPSIRGSDATILRNLRSGRSEIRRENDGA
jgi:hypothetical protein